MSHLQTSLPCAVEHGSVAKNMATDPLHSGTMSAQAKAAASLRLITALSRRESEILEHASAGRSNKEIARHLGLGSNGVKFHLKNIYTKLGARCRIAAVRIAQDHGLIRIASPDSGCLTIIVPTKRSSPVKTRVPVAPRRVLPADAARITI